MLRLDLFEQADPCYMTAFQTLVETRVDCLQKLHFREQNRDFRLRQKVMILFMKVQFLQAVCTVLG
jgi:hypothetical protein